MLRKQYRVIWQTLEAVLIEDLDVVLILVAEMVLLVIDAEIEGLAVRLLVLMVLILGVRRPRRWTHVGLTVHHRGGTSGGGGPGRISTVAKIVR